MGVKIWHFPKFLHPRLHIVVKFHKAGPKIGTTKIPLNKTLLTLQHHQRKGCLDWELDSTISLELTYLVDVCRQMLKKAPSNNIYWPTRRWHWSFEPGDLGSVTANRREWGRLIKSVWRVVSLILTQSSKFFSEVSGIRIVQIPNYFVQSWSCTLVDGRFQASPDTVLYDCCSYK